MPLTLPMLAVARQLGILLKLISHGTVQSVFERTVEV